VRSAFVVPLFPSVTVTSSMTNSVWPVIVDNGQTRRCRSTECGSTRGVLSARLTVSLPSLSASSVIGILTVLSAVSPAAKVQL